MMKSMLAVALLLASCLASEVADDVNAEGRAHVIVLKIIKSDAFPIVEDKAFNVTFYVHNVGDADAHNVEISDEWPEDTFDLVSDDPEADVGAEDGEWAGAVTITFDKIPPGGKELHVITLKPIAAGEFLAKQADVEYSWNEKDEDTDEEGLVTTEAKSTYVGRFPIKTAEEHLKETSYYEKE